MQLLTSLHVVYCLVHRGVMSFSDDGDEPPEAVALGAMAT